MENKNCLNNNARVIDNNPVFVLVNDTSHTINLKVSRLSIPSRPEFDHTQFVFRDISVFTFNILETMNILNAFITGLYIWDGIGKKSISTSFQKENPNTHNMVKYIIETSFYRYYDSEKMTYEIAILFSITHGEDYDNMTIMDNCILTVRQLHDLVEYLYGAEIYVNYNKFLSMSEAEFEKAKKELNE